MAFDGLWKNPGVESTGRLMSFVPSIIALSAMAAVALVITFARGGINADPAALRSAIHTAVLAVACQVLHFAEEVGGGFNRRFPEFFGLDPIAMDSFVGVNLVALAVWVLSVVALRRGASVALFPLWFLAVASVSNALFHPVLAVAVRGNFPGVITGVVAQGVEGCRNRNRLAAPGMPDQRDAIHVGQALAIGCP